MKKPISTLLTVAVFALGTVAAHAQPTVKLLVVDMQKLFEGHWKTVEFFAKSKTDEDLAGVEVGKMRTEGQALVDEYKALVDKANSAILSATEKTKAQEEAQKKYDVLTQKEEALNVFVQNVRQTLANNFQKFKAERLDELTKITSDAAKRKGATLLIDKSGPTGFGIPNIVYTDPAYDITEELMKEINKDRPATPPAAAAKAAASPIAPASDAPPTISLPGVAPKR